MYRNALIAAGLTAMMSLAMPAHGQTVARYAFGMAPPNRISTNPASHYVGPVRVREPRVGARAVNQMLRWGQVGRCVAAADREASLSYVNAKRGSPEATAAAKRLDPAFASCLAGSGIASQGNKAYRRAAVADALGIRIPKQ